MNQGSYGKVVKLWGRKSMNEEFSFFDDEADDATQDAILDEARDDRTVDPAASL